MYRLTAREGERASGKEGEEEEENESGVGWTGDAGWWVNRTPPLVHNYALIALFSSDRPIHVCLGLFPPPRFRAPATCGIKCGWRGKRSGGSTAREGEEG